jgi:triacylglycerol esterase/lipase EstA (alpha/beta hydrolase family)
VPRSPLQSLSPRRRATLIALVAAVALAAGVVVAVVVARGSGGTASARARQDQPGPVLLVPGYGGLLSSLDDLTARLRAAGRDAEAVPMPGDGTGDLTEQARVLNTAVQARLAAGAPSVDLVGYSAGGVVVRLWAKRYDGAAHARRIVTLGSPHHGAGVASLAQAFVPGLCPVACQQLAPGSALLRQLNAGDETPAGPQWLSVWTSQDETVTPPDSAVLAGAVDVRLQSVCADEVVQHSQLPRDPLVLGLVAAAVGTRPITAPAPGQCAQLRALGQG